VVADLQELEDTIKHKWNVDDEMMQKSVNTVEELPNTCCSTECMTDLAHFPLNVTIYCS